MRKCSQQSNELVNIYTVKGSGYYGGGMAVVAATSPAKAKELARAQINDDTWHTDYANGDAFEIVHDVPIGEQVLDHFEMGE